MNTIQITKNGKLFELNEKLKRKKERLKNLEYFNKNTEEGQETLNSAIDLLECDMQPDHAPTYHELVEFDRNWITYENLSPGIQIFLDEQQYSNWGDEIEELNQKIEKLENQIKNINHE